MPFLERDGARLYYETHGAGPALVFVHGLGGGHLSWWQQVPHFRDRYTCVIFDHRGFGLSTESPARPGTGRVRRRPRGARRPPRAGRRAAGGPVDGRLDLPRLRAAASGARAGARHGGHHRHARRPGDARASSRPTERRSRRAAASSAASTRRRGAHGAGAAGAPLPLPGARRALPGPRQDRDPEEADRDADDAARDRRRAPGAAPLRRRRGGRRHPAGGRRRPGVDRARRAPGARAGGRATPSTSSAPQAFNRLVDEFLAAAR